jgi:hypothetical protein
MQGEVYVKGWEMRRMRRGAVGIAAGALLWAGALSWGGALAGQIPAVQAPAVQTPAERCRLLGRCRLGQWCRLRRRS